MSRVAVVLTFLVILCASFGLSGFMGFAFAQSEPETYVVGEISIEFGDIFSDAELEQANPFLKILQSSMNKVHITTRDNVVRRELLFRSGEPFNADLLSETERNLRTLGFLNNIYVVATDTTSDGRINVAVRTRESWTLQAAARYTRASNGDQRWSVSLSETNFLGLGTNVGGGVGSTEISSYWNLWYRHRRMFGAKIWLGIDFSELEQGHAKKIFLSRPFFALSDSWSYELEAWDSAFDVRHYLSHASPAGIDPTASTNLNVILPLREKGFEGRFLVRFKGHTEGRIWRLGAGVRLIESETSIDPAGNILSDGRLVNLEYLLDEGEPLELVQGTTVFPYIWLQSVGRQWTKESFVMQYGPAEDISLGLYFSFKGGFRGEGVGSNSGCDTQFYSEWEMSRWKRLLGGMAVFSGQAKIATGAGNCTMHRASLLGGWIGKTGAENTPWLTRVFTEVGHGANLVGSDLFVLGLDRGLRTLDFDGMAGNRLMRWSVEQGKVTNWQPGGLFRMGGAVFYSGGLAMFDDEERNLGDARHEVGLGLRMGPTRSASAQVVRLDLSWALDGSTGTVFTATTRGTF